MHVDWVERVRMWCMVNEEVFCLSGCDDQHVCRPWHVRCIIVCIAGGAKLYGSGGGSDIWSFVGGEGVCVSAGTDQALEKR